MCTNLYHARPAGGGHGPDVHAICLGFILAQRLRLLYTIMSMWTVQPFAFVSVALFISVTANILAALRAQEGSETCVMYI